MHFLRIQEKLSVVRVSHPTLNRHGNKLGTLKNTGMLDFTHVMRRFCLSFFLPRAMKIPRRMVQRPIPALSDPALSDRTNAMKTSMTMIAVLLAASPAWAQSGNGIDYFNSSEAQITALKQQVTNSQQMLLWHQNQSIQVLMADPRVQAMYQQHRMNGGMLPYPEFAHQYGLTGGFTPEGKRYAGMVRDQITAREQHTWQGVQAAEAARAAAQQTMQTRLGENQRESGNHLSGTSTWGDPATGSTYQLPHAAASTPTYDPRTGRYFQMDAFGHYHVSTPQGTWVPMTPYR